jgi:hypothetical protein
VIRPAVLYGAEYWSTKRRHVQQLSVAKMHMLRWICGNTRRYRVRNDDIRAKIRGGTSRGEAYATSFEMVWTYPIEAREGTGS